MLDRKEFLLGLYRIIHRKGAQPLYRSIWFISNSPVLFCRLLLSFRLSFIFHFLLQSKTVKVLHSFTKGSGSGSGVHSQSSFFPLPLFFHCKKVSLIFLFLLSFL